jgi:hypothetical protein
VIVLDFHPDFFSESVRGVMDGWRAWREGNERGEFLPPFWALVRIDRMRPRDLINSACAESIRRGNAGDPWIDRLAATIRVSGD